MTTQEGEAEATDRQRSTQASFQARWPRGGGGGSPVVGEGGETVQPDPPGPFVNCEIALDYFFTIPILFYFCVPPGGRGVLPDPR